MQARRTTLRTSIVFAPHSGDTGKRQAKGGWKPKVAAPGADCELGAGFLTPPVGRPKVSFHL